MLYQSTAQHLSNIAECHIRAFPDALASALGKAYVCKMLSWYLSTDKTFLFHIEEEGQCVGYCGGMINDGTLPTGSASGMAQHSFKAAIAAFVLRPWLVFHPEVRAKWPLLWKNTLMKLGLRPKVHAPEQKPQQAKDPHVGLVVIGVDPAHQGKGYGSLLLREFERRALEEYGICKVLLTVKSDNSNAIRIYERNGWFRYKSTGESITMCKFLNK